MEMKTAFYQKPPTVKTSIEIINDARASIRFVDSTRPNTPLDLTERSSFLPNVKRNNSHHKRLGNLKPERLPPSSLLRQKSLQELASVSKDTSDDKKANSRPSSGKSKVKEDIKIEEGGQWDSDSLKTLLYLLEEFVSHPEILLEDGKAVSSMIAMLVKFQVPIDERFISLRTDLLKRIFQALQSDDKKAIATKLTIIQLAIALEPNETNMTKMCKLAYKLLRSCNRDSPIDQELGKAMSAIFLRTISKDLYAENTKSSSLEPIIYSLSCLKLLSAEDNRAKYLVENHGVQIITSKLIIALSTIDLSEKAELSAMTTNICLQFLGVLRNLSEVGNSMERFCNSNTFAAIFDTMICFIENADMILMCSRILSKASLDAECCRHIAGVIKTSPDDTETQVINTFFLLGNVLFQFQDNQDISVRLAFAVGNLVTEYPECAQMMAISNFRGEMAIDLFVNSLMHFLETFSTMLTKENSKSTDGLDVIIKVSRLLANSAADSSVGQRLADSVDFHDCTLQCLAFIKKEKTKKNSPFENLLVATLAALNNITFAALEKSDDSIALWSKRIIYAQALIPFMILHPQSPLLLDALHVMANFCRFSDVRKFLLDLKTLDLFLTLLQAGSRELAFVICGILVNISIDVQVHKTLIVSGCLERLYDVIILFANPVFLSEPSGKPFFLPLVDVSCKLLLNLTGSSTKNMLPIEVARNLHTVFSVLLQNLKQFPKLVEDEEIVALFDNLIPTLLSRLQSSP